MQMLFRAVMLLCAWVVVAQAVCLLEWEAPTEDSDGNPLVGDDLFFRVYVVPIGEPFILGEYTCDTEEEVIPCDMVGMVPGMKARVTAVRTLTGAESNFSDEVAFEAPPPPPPPPPVAEVSAPTALHLVPASRPGKIKNYSACTLVWDNPPEASLAQVELFIRLGTQQYNFAQPWQVVSPATPGAEASVACDYPATNTVWYTVVRGVNTAGIPGPVSNEVVLRWVAGGGGGR